jgi:hypothetical protein
MHAEHQETLPENHWGFARLNYARDPFRFIHIATMHVTLGIRRQKVLHTYAVFVYIYSYAADELRAALSIWPQESARSAPE